MSKDITADLLPSEYDAALTLFLMGAALLCLFSYCCHCCFNNEQTDMGFELIGKRNEHTE